MEVEPSDRAARGGARRVAGMSAGTLERPSPSVQYGGALRWRCSRAALGPATPGRPAKARGRRSAATSPPARSRCPSASSVCPAISPTPSVLETTTIPISDRIPCRMVADRTPEKRPAEVAGRSPSPHGTTQQQEVVGGRLLQPRLRAPVGVFAGHEDEAVGAADLLRERLQHLGRAALRVLLVHAVEHRQADHLGVDNAPGAAPCPPAATSTRNFAGGCPCGRTQYRAVEHQNPCRPSSLSSSAGSERRGYAEPADVEAGRP